MHRNPWVGLIMSAGPMLAMMIFIGLPIVLAVAYSLGDVWGLNRAIAAVAQHQVIVRNGLTLRVYRELWSNPGIRADIGTTLWVTVAAVAVVLVMAYTVSLYLRFNQNPLARLVRDLFDPSVYPRRNRLLRTGDILERRRICRCHHGSPRQPRISWHLVYVGGGSHCASLGELTVCDFDAIFGTYSSTRFTNRRESRCRSFVFAHDRSHCTAA